MVRNIKLTLAYDGTQYFGWQTQKNRPTIQETLETNISIVMKEKINLIGSGRTDRGVHALGQVANFKATTKIPEDKIKIAINAKLPSDIRVLESREVDIDFNSRFNAVDKTYIYQIYNSSVANPFYSRYSWFVPQNLDLTKMEEALQLIVGTHDFKGFMATGSSVKSTIRTIYEANLVTENNLLKIYIKGNGFLYNMVRIIAGTIIDIGRGLKDISSIDEVLIEKDRSLLGRTAPPEGLFLMNVNYE
ncbi:MAG: tRNA pseudouridine(38-40) synthase TruA [Tissierellia bacterium]|nr:tRNA pseudouridine(38-40) synthase TruA [Tissierellia bacterium]